MSKAPETPKKNDWAVVRECLGPDGKLSIVMPAFRLAAVITENLERVCALFRGSVPFEVIIVDDGSSDATAARIRGLAAAHPEIKPLLLHSNSGKGAALMQGFTHSTGTHVLLLDADLDIPPEQTPVFFKIMRRRNADVVIGSKRHPRSRLDYPWQRRLASIVYYGMARLLVGVPVRDTQTGMKLFRRPALKYAFDRILVKHFAFDLEVLSILHNAGYRIAEAPVEIQFGDKIGCLNWSTVRKIIKDTLAIFYRLRILRYYQSLRPLKMPDPVPSVSVVIACPAPSRYLEECLAGLAGQTMKPTEIIVLPDRPHPDYPWPPGLRVVPTGPVRPARKRNLGIREARGEIVAFIDDDAAPLENWIERALPYFSSPEIGAVGGPAITPPREPPRAAAGGRVYANRLVSGKYRYRFLHDRVRESDDLPSCNLLARRNALEAIGGFRTDYWPGEDTLLCLALRRDLNLKIIYDPWVAVRHHRRALFRPHLRQIARYARHRGFFFRHFPETSRRVSYTLPSLFVLGLVLGPVAVLFLPALRPVYLGIVGFYLAATLLGSFDRRFKIWMLTWAGILATHLVYGTFFMLGLPARKMPEALTPFDHPSERP